MGKVRAGVALIVTLLLAAALVGGCGSGDDTASGDGVSEALALGLVEQDALAQYQLYLQGEAEQLAKQVALLQGEIAAGNVSAARFTYDEGRVNYGHLLPALMAFRAGGESVGVPSGFHGIKQAISEDDVGGLKPATAALIADVQGLRDAFARAEVQPEQLARAAGQLMDDVSGRMVPGRQGNYVGSELVDIAAAVEGVGQALAALRPPLEHSSPNFVLRLEGEFAETYERLVRHGTPARELPPGRPGAGATFVAYIDPASPYIGQIAESLGDLRDVVLEVPAHLAETGSGDDTASGDSVGEALALGLVEQDALAQYKLYLQGEAEQLAKQVALLKDDVAAGDRTAARSAYAEGRVHYGHLLPAAGVLGRAMQRVDGRPGEGPDSDPHGFHGIERILFGEETTNGLAPTTAALVADARRLRRAIERVEMQPAQIARGTGEMMDAVSGRMVDGREEPYARIDSVDISASVEGAERALEALRPPLEHSDPAFALGLDAEFLETYERLAKHGTPAHYEAPGAPGAGTQYVTYLDMKPHHKRRIRRALRDLQEVVLEVPAQLAEG